MDWIIWLVVIVAIVAIVWWLLNRNSSRGRPGSGAVSAAADDATPPHVRDADRGPSHRGALSGGGSAASASDADLSSMPTSAGFNRAEPGAEPAPEPDSVAVEDSAAAEAHASAQAEAAPAARAAEPAAEPASAEPRAAAEDAPAGGTPEWETQWSETPLAEPHGAVHPPPGHGAATGSHLVDTPEAGGAAGTPVHHPEYTEPHAPTLPGAESAAAEASLDADSGDARTARSAAVAEAATGHEAEPAGHLAADQPYGEGSAAPAADGSGPEDFTVKGQATSMLYYEETNPAFGEIRAEVWFLSAAHAEAAGFRPPRRTRQ
ncbi:MAG: hypothetical protein ABWX85_03075 [Arthrobacter sp.]